MRNLLHVIFSGIALWFTVALGVAIAHSLPPTEIDVRFEGNTLYLEIPLVLEELTADMAVQLNPEIDTMLVVDMFDQIVTADAQTVIDAFEPYANSFIHDFRILNGDESFQANITHIDVPEPNPNGAPRQSTIYATATIPSAVHAVEIGWGEENGDLAVVNAANGELDYLVDGALSRPIARNGAIEQSISAVDYIKIGFIHIIPRGLDHILFVLGISFTLMLGANFWCRQRYLPSPIR